MKNSRSPAASQSQVDPIMLARIVLRRWGWMAAVLGVILAAAAVAVTVWVWEPVYEAKQFVQIMQNREYTDIMAAVGKQTDAKEILAPLKSEFLLDKLLQDEELLKLRPDIDLKQLKKLLRHEGAGGELYTIICRDVSPKFAALVTQKLSAKFVDFHLSDRRDNLQELMSTLNKQIAAEELELKSIASQLEALNAQKLMPSSGSSGNDPVDPDGSYYTQMLKDLYNERLKLEETIRQRDRLQTALDNVEQQYNESVEAGIVANIMASPAIAAIESHLRDLEDQKSGSKLGESHPKVAELSRLIKRVREKRQTTYEREFELGKSAWINGRKNELLASIEELEGEVEASKSKITNFNLEVDRLETELRNINKRGFEFEQLLVKQERAYDGLDKSNQQMNRIQSKDMSIYPVALRGEVIVPTEPVERYPYKILGIVATVAFLLPFAAAFAWEFHLSRIGSPEQIEKQLSVELVGEVTHLPIRFRRSRELTSKRGLKQLRLYEESVDNLSAILSHSAAQQVPLVMSVTSAVSNEGKTTLSSQLAISAARSHLGRTLLIDADLRSPSLHRVFDGSLEIGLADVLANTLPLSEAISKTDIDNLDLLTAGKIRNNPRRYFTDTNWAELLELARQEYDHVIVDTPPLLAASESLAISKSCDFALICVLRDVSRTYAVKLACERLVSADVKVIGCAFGGVPQHEYATRYGNYGYNMS